MFAFTKEEQEVYQEDSKSHPSCSYSINTRKKCSDKDGEFVCETLRQLQRVCPQKNPFTIYSQAKQSTSRDEIDEIFGPLQRFESERDRLLDPFAFFEESLRNFSPDLFNSHDFQLQLPHSDQRKPRVFMPKPPEDSSKFRGTLVNDSVEEI
eukprot:gene1163-1234_t